MKHYGKENKLERLITEEKIEKSRLLDFNILKIEKLNNEKKFMKNVVHYSKEYHNIPPSLFLIFLILYLNCNLNLYNHSLYN